MKALLYTALLTVSLLAVASPVTTQATPLHQAVDAKVDNLGDADITMKMRFDARGWQMWTKTIGENPSLFKRELKRMFSKMVLSDYRLERNDLDREMTFHFHAVGFSRYMGNSHWEFDVDMGNVEQSSVTRRKLNDSTYLMSVAQSDPMSGALVQQEMTISLPESSGSLQETTSEMGSSVLRYQLAPPKVAAPVLVPVAAGGGTLCLAGIGVFSMLMFGKRKGDGAADLVALDPPAKADGEMVKSA
ncbi:MAG: hypothetical protein KDN22_01320 [Verrucomicrobiae bacterium]|nr:hypothetical protein [Verrucomicrobiae bacterium]